MAVSIFQRYGKFIFLKKAMAGTKILRYDSSNMYKMKSPNAFTSDPSALESPCLLVWIQPHFRLCTSSAVFFTIFFEISKICHFSGLCTSLDGFHHLHYSEFLRYDTFQVVSSLAGFSSSFVIFNICLFMSTFQVVYLFGWFFTFFIEKSCTIVPWLQPYMSIVEKTILDANYKYMNLRASEIERVLRFLQKAFKPVYRRLSKERNKGMCCTQRFW